jgi:hypothetical protein
MENANKLKTPLFAEVNIRKEEQGVVKKLGKYPEKWLAYTLKHIVSTKPENLHRHLPEEWTE